MSKPKNEGNKRYVANRKRYFKLLERGEYIKWCMIQHCYVWEPK